jgi:hypothetical protein
MHSIDRAAEGAHHPGVRFSPLFSVIFNRKMPFSRAFEQEMKEKTGSEFGALINPFTYAM